MFKYNQTVVAKVYTYIWEHCLTDHLEKVTKVFSLTYIKLHFHYELSRYTLLKLILYLRYMLRTNVCIACQCECFIAI